MLADRQHLRMPSSFPEAPLSPRAADDLLSTTSENQLTRSEPRQRGFTHFKPPAEERSDAEPQSFFNFPAQPQFWPQAEENAQTWPDPRLSFTFRPSMSAAFGQKAFLESLEHDIRRQFVEFLPNLLKHLERFSQSAPQEAGAEPTAAGCALNAEPQRKEERVNLSLLQNLNNYLVKILKGQSVTEEEINLSWIEKALLASIINKKFAHKKLKRVERISDLTSEFLLEFPINVSKLASLKRTEENYKIVFNWCFKFLKRKLAERLIAEGHKPLCKRELENYFYNFYFKEVSEGKGLELIKFAKPNFTNKVQNGEKTFNSNFISNIQLSAHFMGDFFQALDFFVPTHIELINKKLASLLLKWEEDLLQSSEAEEAVRRISNYIMKSSKCKLPWSLREIEAAHRTVLSLFK